MTLSIPRLTRSIGGKLQIALLGATLTSAAIVGAVGYDQQHDASDRAVESALRQRFDAVNAALNEQGQRALGIAQALANDPMVGDALLRQDRPALLARFVPLMEKVKPLNIGLITFHLPSGVALARAHAPDSHGDSVVARRKMVADALRTGEIRVGVEPGRENISVFATVPAFAGGKLVGDVDLGVAAGASFLKEAKARFGIEVATHVWQNEAVTTLGATFDQKTLLTPDVHKAAMTAPTAWREATLGERPVGVLAGPLKNYSGQAIGTIEIALDISSFVVARNTALLTLLLVLAAVSAGAIGLAVLLTRHIGTPIRRLDATMTALAAGDLTQDVPATGRGDEVGAMARSVAVFRDALVEQRRLEAEQLAESDAKMRQAERLNGLVRGFEGSVGGIVDMVSASATELQATAQHLAASAEETTGRASAVATAAGQAGANVTSVASAAEELGASVGEIGRQVQHSRSRSEEAVSETRTTAAIVSELSEAATRIEDIVVMISGIAGQTNLLALNATIEAARAGEAGRGFAVVASEVKALAEQTSRATSEISGQISGIQATTQRAVSAIDHISQTIQDINASASAIAGAVDQQGAATREIVEAVTQASRGTREVTSSIGMVSRTAAETGDAAGQVFGASEELARQSEVLRAQVRVFLSDVRAA